MVEKRPGEDGAEPMPAPKRSRFSDAPPAAAAGAPAGMPPQAAGPGPASTSAAPAGGAPKAMSISKEALEKAKKALELQKALQAKLKALPIKQPAAAAAAGPPGTASAAPAPAAAAAMPSAAAPAPKRLELITEPEPEPIDSRFFDPSMQRGVGRQRRARATFSFVEEGSFQRQAAQLRHQQEMEEIVARHRKEAAKPAGPEALPPPEESAPDAPPPEAEWWDRKLLATGSYAADVPLDEAGNPSGTPQFKAAKVTHLIEHPVPLEPPAEGPPPPPQPLKLTKRELKKLRTQRRQAREKEKQELIRQGLLEAPKPKVRLANLMRVLGAEATADPTAIEQEVRRQMAERQAAHDDRNLARKLLPSERKEKKLRKLFDDEDAEKHVAVYRIDDCSDPSNRFKVDVNAQENHMTGALLLCEPFSLVVVEGCSKAHKRYAKLMLRRIDWTKTAKDPIVGGEDGEQEEADEDAAGRKHGCHLVWRGVLTDPCFDSWKVYKNCSVEKAREVLEDVGVNHYWDIAANFNPDDAPPIEL